MAEDAEQQSDRNTLHAERQALIAGLQDFQVPSASRSMWQITTTLLAYLAVIALMYLAMPISIWLSLVLAVPAAGLVVRIFIIQHDCGHAAYFRSSRANQIAGRICSLVTLTPFANWRRHHALHHAVWNNIDQRQDGIDIYVKCITLNEYHALSSRSQWLYRLSQHPIVTQLLIPPFVFLLLFRAAFDTPKSWWRERRSVYVTNIVQLAIFGALALSMHWQAIIAVHLPVIILASIIGIWLFAVQHRFEGVKWLPEAEWSSTRAVLQGTSYLKLPTVLQWFTGNIGFHHIHHLLPRVPNYKLEACHDTLIARGVTFQTLNLLDAFRALRFTLWDETGNQMVPFPP